MGGVSNGPIADPTYSLTSAKRLDTYECVKKEHLRTNWLVVE